MTEHFELRFDDGSPAGCFRYHSADDARRWARLIGGDRPIRVVRVVTAQAETVVAFDDQPELRAA